jgi:hypothetical protein
MMEEVYTPTHVPKGPRFYRRDRKSILKQVPERPRRRPPLPPIHLPLLFGLSIVGGGIDALSPIELLVLLGEDVADGEGEKAAEAGDADHRG